MSSPFIPQIITSYGYFAYEEALHSRGIYWLVRLGYGGNIPTLLAWMKGDDVHSYECYTHPFTQQLDNMDDLPNADWVDDLLDSEFDSDG